MRVPSLKDLDTITKLIGGPAIEKFVELGPEARISVLTLAMRADMAEIADDIAVNLYSIAEWFRNSKVYYP